jgi:hypothetical protein
VSSPRGKSTAYNGQMWPTSDVESLIARASPLPIRMFLRARCGNACSNAGPRSRNRQWHNVHTQTDRIPQQEWRHLAMGCRRLSGYRWLSMVLLFPGPPLEAVRQRLPTCNRLRLLTGRRAVRDA